jgi:hypothetical protein
MANYCYESGEGSFLATILCLILGAFARPFLAVQKQLQRRAPEIPKAATIAAEIQNQAALVTAACVFWAAAGADVFKFPWDLAAAAMLSAFLVLWAVSAALGLWRGNRAAWHASIAGSLVCVGLLVWCGGRNPLFTLTSSALLGAPLILLLLPRATNFYFAGAR